MSYLGQLGPGRAWWLASQPATVRRPRIVIRGGVQQTVPEIPGIDVEAARSVNWWPVAGIAMLALVTGTLTPRRA